MAGCIELSEYGTRIRVPYLYVCESAFSFQIILFQIISLNRQTEAGKPVIRLPARAGSGRQKQENHKSFIKGAVAGSPPIWADLYAQTGDPHAGIMDFSA